MVVLDNEQVVVARNACTRYGKGLHAARLNFGDCAVYALAATSVAPLLFKGQDFAVTDLDTCL